MGLISKRLMELVDAAVPELVAGTSLYNDYFPDDPSVAVTINELPGLPHELAFEGQPVTSQANIQVKSRGTGTNEVDPTRVLAWKVHRALWEMCDVAGVTPADPNIVVVLPRQDPVFLERDDQDRVVYVANYFVSASWRS